MDFLNAGAMFAEENAARRAEADRRHAEDLEHEQHIGELLADKDVEIDRLKYIAREFRGLLWRVQDTGLLPIWASDELGRLESLHDDAIDVDDGDES